MSLKRVLLAVLALLIALVLGTPWWIGRDAERRYREFVASLELPVSASIESYDRGWFTSRARLRLAPAGPAAAEAFRALGAPSADPVLVLEDRIAHGLLPLGTAGGWFARPALVMVEGELRLPGSGGRRPVAVIGYRVPPLGGLELSVKSPGPANGGLDPAGWDDLQLQIGLPPRHGNAWLELDADGLALPVPDGRLAFRALRARLELNLPRTGLPTGTGTVSADALALTTPGGEKWLAEMEAIEFEAGLGTEGPTAHARLEGRIARVGSPRETYGPGRFRFDIGGLDVSSLERLAGSLSRLAGRGLDERAMTMALAGSLLAEAPRLLAHGPVAELTDAVLASPEGRISAQGRLALKSVEPVVLNNPFLLQHAVTGTLDVTIPPVAARHGALLYLRQHGKLSQWGSPEAWLEDQVARGRLVRDNGEYRINVRLSDGRLQVNRRPWAALGMKMTDRQYSRGDYERQ